MSDHDTITPETDDELRTRLRAFAEEVKERTDTEAALERTPRRSRPPTIRLLAIAACVALAVALAAVVMVDPQAVDTVPADDLPTTLARGVVDFVGSPVDGCGIADTLGAVRPADCLAGRTLDITAVEEDGEVTGEARFNGIVVQLECLDTTAPNGVVALGGEVTESPGDGALSVGSMIGVIVREGEPDSATVWPDQHDSCAELFRSIPQPWSDFFETFVDVVDGDEIETGRPTQASDCPSTTQPRRITSGGQMKNRLGAPVASAATAIILLGGCSDDGPTTLAKGEDVELVGDENLGGQTLDINAEEEDGKVTGELRFTDSGGEVVVTVECADTETDGVVILAGTAESTDEQVTGRLALIIREGDPDSATVWFELPLPAGEVAAGSCGEFVESLPEEASADSNFVDVEAGDDIETG